MLRLRDALGHTITLAKVTAGIANMVDAIEGSGVINIGVRIGRDLPLHANAGGKLVLAFGPPEAQQSIDSLTLDRYTGHTITDMATLKAEIETVRRQGWASAPEEFVIGINAVSAPIYDNEGNLRATLGLVNSIQFLGRHPAVEQIEALLAAAAEISGHLALTRQRAA
jgi:DNA-binding IclR family transcriptional regulator